MNLHGYQKGLLFLSPVSFRKEEFTPVEVKSQTEQLLDYIFSVDERTGLPCGAYAQYMSDKTNPEVKKFIEDTILHGGEPMANMVDAQNQGVPSNISEKFREFKSDFLADMHRGRGETLEDYEQRIGHFLRNEKTIAEYRMKYAKSSDDEKNRYKGN